MRKYLFFVLLMMGVLFSHSIIAKTKLCLVKPTYNILINQDSVQIVNDSNNLIIHASGRINLNGQNVKVKPIIQSEAKDFQLYLRQQLPLFEEKAYWQLNDTNVVFENAIRDKLGNDSEILDVLNQLHSQLLILLHQAIATKEGVTYFYYQPFNNIKKDSEELGKKMFYKILGDSFWHFNFVKNYSAIKKIATDEWKGQKNKLKIFDAQVCELITNMDDQYHHLMIGLTIQ